MDDANRSVIVWAQWDKDRTSQMVLKSELGGGALHLFGPVEGRVPPGKMRKLKKIEAKYLKEARVIDAKTFDKKLKQAKKLVLGEKYVTELAAELQKVAFPNIKADKLIKHFEKVLYHLHKLIDILSSYI